jgi:hypothetical protein
LKEQVLRCLSKPLANPKVKWETSEQTDIGFDATVIKKLNVSFDYYIKKTKDWLLTVPILATAGADAPLINGGDVRIQVLNFLLIIAIRLADPSIIQLGRMDHIIKYYWKHSYS